MPWNQPGSGDGNHRPSGDGGPPDIDEILRDLKNRLNAFLGGGKGGNGSADGGSPSGGINKGVVVLGLFVAVGLWLFSGVYTVQQGEQGVELRFGKYQETTEAGLHWHVPNPIEQVIVVNTQNVNTVEVGYRKGSSNSFSTVPREALMLTQDENIIDIQFAVQYDIKSPTDLLFNVSEFNSRTIAETVVRQATESAVREIVGRSTMDFAITEGRARLAAETKVLVQRILDRYTTGINVRTVEMQNAQPPSQVKNAFDDVVRAREDEERIKNLAQAYANDIIPKARGFAARITEEAEAYKESTVAKSSGEAARFTRILAEYRKAPLVTRERLYIEAMEEVLSNSSKMMIDQQSGNNVIYLPLDQLLRNRDNAAKTISSLPSVGEIGQAISNSGTNDSSSVTRSSRGSGRTN